MSRFRNIVTLPLILFVFSLSGQPLSDTSFVKTAYLNTVQFYEKSIGFDNGLYSGVAYDKPDFTDEEHPFYINNDWVTGDIIYNDQYYSKVPFVYDIRYDLLISEGPSHQEMVLVKGKIKSFSIGDARFINIRGGTNLENGIYEQLYTGPSTVLCKHVKSYQERIERNTLEPYYVQKDYYYVLQNGEYKSISSKADLLKIFKDKKTDLKGFIRKNRLVVSKKNPGAFAEVARFYDSLTATK